jgi:UDP-2,4-diacetamido-2,4,6-trideoxy-beta-L-altropyranose hydrolase
MEKGQNELSMRSSMHLEIRRVSEADLMIIFEWANEKAVRSQSFNIRPISLEEHSQWFKKKLLEDNCYFYILIKKDIPLGQVRFDISDRVSNINYSIDKNFRGMGYGFPLLNIAIQEFKKECLSYDSICASVKPDNKPSNKVFINLGFSLDEKYDDSLVYILDNK